MANHVSKFIEKILDGFEIEPFTGTIKYCPYCGQPLGTVKTKDPDNKEVILVRLQSCVSCGIQVLDVVKRTI